jgi:AcrR family transcriptional regulator
MVEKPAAEVEISPFLRLLWHGQDDSRPGPKRGVDLPTIAAAGVRIADADGLSAVSMRRLATEVGFTTMALYRYVQSKLEVLALVMDHAYGEPPRAVPESVGWRAGLAAWAQANRDVIVAHPWILEIRITEPPLTPAQIGWLEAGLATLAEVPLSEQEKLSSMLLVDVYVRGQAQLSIGISPSGPDSQRAAEQYSHRLRALADPVRYPHIHTAVLSGALDDDDADFAVDEFTFGLDSVLDGIAARIQRRTERSGRRGAKR